MKWWLALWISFVLHLSLLLIASGSGEPKTYQHPRSIVEDRWWDKSYRLPDSPNIEDRR